MQCISQDAYSWELCEIKSNCMSTCMAQHDKDIHIWDARHHHCQHTCDNNEFYECIGSLEDLRENEAKWETCEDKVDVEDSCLGSGVCVPYHLRDQCCWGSMVKLSGCRETNGTVCSD